MFYAFLQSTQWYTPDDSHKYEALANIIHSLLNVADSRKTLPTNTGAVAEEGSGVYSSYASDGEPKTYWALRDYGDIPACTVLCAGNGMDHTEQFHSEYTCDSLLGIRPAIVLPLSSVKELAGEKE